jgi:hypothetical protein
LIQLETTKQGDDRPSSPIVTNFLGNGQQQQEQRPRCNQEQALVNPYFAGTNEFGKAAQDFRNRQAHDNRMGYQDKFHY